MSLSGLQLIGCFFSGLCEIDWFKSSHLTATRSHNAPRVFLTHPVVQVTIYYRSVRCPALFFHLSQECPVSLPLFMGSELLLSSAGWKELRSTGGFSRVQDFCSCCCFILFVFPFSLGHHCFSLVSQLLLTFLLVLWIIPSFVCLWARSRACSNANPFCER